MLSKNNIFTNNKLLQTNSSKIPLFFVWGVWLGMLFIALACVYRYGRNIPLAEDWLLVAPLTGNEPDLAGWLWRQNAEHRVPLPKIIYLFLLKITHGDFRSGMVFNVLSVGFLSAAFILVFKYIRGKTIYADAFFPIIFLHLGHWANLFWSWQIGFVLPTLFTCILFAIVLSYTGLLQMRVAIIAGICIVCLPLCGANGLMYQFMVLPLLVYETFLHFRSRESGASRKVAALLLSAIVLSLLIVIAYFIQYEHPYWNPPSPSIKATLLTSAKFLALSFGPSSANSWNFAMFSILFLVAVTSFLLLKNVIKFRNVEFRRAFGILFLMGGCMMFALVMGWGRAAWIPKYGLPIRYVILAVPTLIICYGTWELYGLPLLKRGMQWALFIVMLLLILPNSKAGFLWRNWYVGDYNKVMKDINDGIPHTQLAERNKMFLLHWDKKNLIIGMQQLKKAGMGPFINMKDDSLKTDTSSPIDQNINR
jgi:heme/copper-type cytochrome/quinol oxidase subunit 4